VSRTVVITGAGLVTPLGRGVRTNWCAIDGGTCGLSEEGDPQLPAWMRWSGRVQDIELPPRLDQRLMGQARFLNRGARLGLLAAHDAVSQAAPLDAVPAGRRAFFLATGDLTTADCADLQPATRAATASSAKAIDSEQLNRETIARVNPFFLLQTLANNPYSFLSAAFTLMGPGTTMASHSPGGSQALELAARCVRSHRADMALVVGCGSWLSEVPRLEMAGLGLLSSCRSGAASYRPFGPRRDGFVVGEGAAAVVLEPASTARARGARVLATIDGVGSCLETRPGLAVADRVTYRSMCQALGDASRQASDLGFVCAHGSGTRKGDRSELESIRALLGDAATKVPVCALKPYTGHMGAASDVAEVILGIRAAAQGTVPATPNFRGSTAETGEMLISSHPQRCHRPCFLSASYGLGGQASAIAVTTNEDEDETTD
jgi:3-oxoacyl-[acyl-carrier-protein] synthase II